MIFVYCDDMEILPVRANSCWTVNIRACWLEFVGLLNCWLADCWLIASLDRFSRALVSILTPGNGKQAVHGTTLLTFPDETPEWYLLNSNKFGEAGNRAVFPTKDTNIDTISPRQSPHKHHDENDQIIAQQTQIYSFNQNAKRLAQTHNHKAKAKAKGSPSKSKSKIALAMCHSNQYVSR